MPVPVEWYDHRDEDSAIVAANATPVANVLFGPNREGFIWYIERLNWHVGGTHTALVKVFVITSDAPGPDDAGRQDYNAAATDGVRDYTNPLVVPPGYKLVVNFTAGTLANTDPCLVTIQRAWCLTNPGSAYGAMSPADRLALASQEENEKLEREFATVVGGSGWQYTDDAAGFDTRATENQDDVNANGYQVYAQNDANDPQTFDDVRDANTMAPLGQYVGSNRLGAQHPRPPYRQSDPPDSTDHEQDSFGTGNPGTPPA